MGHTGFSKDRVKEFGDGLNVCLMIVLVLYL